MDANRRGSMQALVDEPFANTPSLCTTTSVSADK
jgi:hypothetical protein